MQTLVEKLSQMMVASTPLLSVPQLSILAKTKAATGMSLISWTLFAVFTLPWIYYALKRKDRLLTMVYTANFIIYSLIAGLIVLYS